MTTSETQLEELTRRTTGLYSLPAVAMEVLRLTENPAVDAHALKNCVEKDPALTAKILRVVNSSLFGLSHEVADLNQALALLGVKPLKLLVLGFSLPDKLFQGVESDRLKWYWTRTLTRAVAARQISESLWNQPGDEALVAGLLQDIGVLALLRELGTTYARFLNSVIDDRDDLSRREVAALGFHNSQLSASLLEHWKLPRRFVEAIAMPRHEPRKLAAQQSREAELAKILHLADLMAQLVGGHRLQVLPELLEVGELYRGLSRPRLTELVEALQPQVDQLADVLSLALPEGRDYKQVLLEAHARMADVAEQTAGLIKPADRDSVEETYDVLWNESQELAVAMSEFLTNDRGQLAHRQFPRPAEEEHMPRWNDGHAPHERTAGEQVAGSAASPQTDSATPLLECIKSAARGCRMRRQELSLVLVEIDQCEEMLLDGAAEMLRQARQVLHAACHSLVEGVGTMNEVTPARVALVLPDYERRQAVGLGHQVIDRMQRLASSNQVSSRLQSLTLSIGAATVANVPKNFGCSQLIESAARCLAAARSCGGSTVKSIEVY